MGKSVLETTTKVKCLKQGTKSRLNRLVSSSQFKNISQSTLRHESKNVPNFLVSTFFILVMNSNSMRRSPLKLSRNMP
jgi:hypothetical protein